MFVNHVYHMQANKRTIPYLLHYHINLLTAVHRFDIYNTLPTLEWCLNISYI